MFSSATSPSNIVITISGIANKPQKDISICYYSMMNSGKQYIATADVLRIVAIIAVIAIHTTTRSLEASTFALQKIPFTFFFNQILRFAVPLFFIISGFVLELNYHLHESYLTYFKKRLNRILIPYIFWSAVYYFFVYDTNHNPSFLNALLQGNASYQLYFIPALLIFYFLFPLIHKYFKMISNTWVILSLFILQLLLLYYDYHIHPLPFFDPLKIVLLNYFSFILGVFVSKNHMSFIQVIKKRNLLFLFGAIIFGIYIFYQGFHAYITTHNYLMFYSQWRPSVLVYTIFLGGFLYWVFDRDILHVAIVKKLSKLSVFVFFIHVLILQWLWTSLGQKFFKLQFAQNLWWDPLYFITVTLLSFILAYIAHKIPYLSKLTG